MAKQRHDYLSLKSAHFHKLHRVHFISLMPLVITASGVKSCSLNNLACFFFCFQRKWKFCLFRFWTFRHMHLCVGHRWRYFFLYQFIFVSYDWINTDLFCFSLSSFSNKKKAIEMRLNTVCEQRHLYTWHLVERIQM